MFPCVVPLVLVFVCVVCAALLQVCRFCVFCRFRSFAFHLPLSPALSLSLSLFLLSVFCCGAFAIVGLRFCSTRASHREHVTSSRIPLNLHVTGKSQAWWISAKHCMGGLRNYFYPYKNNLALVCINTMWAGYWLTARSLFHCKLFHFALCRHPCRNFCLSGRCRLVWGLSPAVWAGCWDTLLLLVNCITCIFIKSSYRYRLEGNLIHMH